MAAHGHEHKCGVKNPPVRPGGWSPEQPADAEVQALCDSVKSEFLEQSGVNAKEFLAITYRMQIVAGTNYLVKVSLGDDQYCVLQIFQPLPYTGEKPELTAFKCNKTKDEPIVTL